jgi:hypothetical protein
MAYHIEAAAIQGQQGRRHEALITEQQELA